MRFRSILSLLAALTVLASPALAKDVLVVGNTADAKTMDPHAITDVYSNYAAMQIFECLVDMDEHGQFHPWLAESWEQPDPKTYVFHLRQGVKFHNGEELTSEDVLFSMERATTPAGAAVKAYADLLDLPGCEAPDRYTVILRTKEPSAPFLATLTNQFGYILNRKAVEEAQGDISRSAVGTGPYIFDQWIRGDRIILQRNEDYYGEKPYFKTLVLRAIPEDTTRMIELETGNVDFCYSVQPSQVQRMREEGRVTVFSAPGTSLNHMGFNCEVEPFNNPLVRQAIDYAIDKDGILGAVFYDMGQIPAGPWPSSLKYTPEGAEPRPYDPDKAKELLKEAGYPKGFKMSIYTNDRKERIDIATIIQAQLAEVGIDAEIQTMEWGTFTDVVSRGEYQTFIMGWSSSMRDPYFFVNRTLHSSSIGATNNARFNDPEVDRLLIASASVMDGPERAALYKELWEKVVYETPWSWLTVPDLVYAKNSNLKGTENFEVVRNYRYSEFYYED